MSRFREVERFVVWFDAVAAIRATREAETLAASEALPLFEAGFTAKQAAEAPRSLVEHFGKLWSTRAHVKNVQILASSFGARSHEKGELGEESEAAE